MTQYVPDAWVLLRLTTKKHGIVDKILAGWNGSYAAADSWRLNSGVTETKETEDSYEFSGQSGSVYICSKDRQRLTDLTSSIYVRFKEDIEAYKEDTDETASIQIIHLGE